ncbi:MAG: carboxypeptidase regulatory-like domain-containing protein [Candidatus Diapherotrites archaeon]|uniref:Carboxypeptidase regulatory-like domain-containing protein n=1 Tax=Candidatus Iainarchaeum sp. TaxID=3101447 RepID=A0A8T3YI02_9ARCH|nr:carboxypeptidase regulatory-like domain-containing protein [Candidatus Diapherotrites archaeon]
MNRSTILAVAGIMLVLSFLSGCRSDSPLATTSNSVKIAVVDESGAPAGGANITILRVGTIVSYTQADARGNAVVQLSSTGTYTFGAISGKEPDSKSGFVTAEVSAGENSVRIVLAKKAYPPYVFRFRVVDEAGNLFNVVENQLEYQYLLGAYTYPLERITENPFDSYKDVNVSYFRFTAPGYEDELIYAQPDIGAYFDGGLSRFEPKQKVFEHTVRMERRKVPATPTPSPNVTPNP